MSQTPNLLLNKHPSGSAQSNNAVINSNWTKLDTAIGNTIGRGDLASRPITGEFSGATYWVTDQDGVLCYVWDGAAWETKLGAAGHGLLVNRPASAATGWVYIPTDVADVVLYVWDGSTWVSKSGGGGGGGSSEAIGTGANPFGDETYPSMTLDEAKALLSDYCSQIRVYGGSLVTEEFLNTDSNFKFKDSTPVVSTNGMVYMMTVNNYNHDVYKFDYRDNSFTKIIDNPFGATFSYYYSSGGLAGDGKIIFVSEDKGLWINPEDDSYGTASLTVTAGLRTRIIGVKSEFGNNYNITNGFLVTGINNGKEFVRYRSNFTSPSSTITVPDNKYITAYCRLPNGKIMMMSNSGGSGFLYSTTAGTFETLTGVPSGSFYTNGTLLPNGKVAWVSTNSTDPIRLYDINDDTWSDSNQTTGIIGYVNKLSSTCLLPSGELYLPNNINETLKLYDYRTNDITSHGDIPFDDTSPYGNQFKTCARRMLPNGKVLHFAGATNFDDYPTVIDFGFKDIGRAMASNPLLLGLV